MGDKRYAAVVIPPPNIAEQAILLSRVLAAFGSYFVLDGVTRHPHLTLYRAPFVEATLPAVIDALDAVARTTTPFLLRQETYYPDQGVWTGVRYVADKAILDLHTLTIDWLRDKRVVENDTRYRVQWTQLTDGERENIEYCGWKHSYLLYSPHQSFTKLREPRRDVFAHILQPEFSFQADHIGLYEVGEHNTCTRLVADFHLTGPSAPVK